MTLTNFCGEQSINMVQKEGMGSTKLPKRVLPNFLVRIISHLDTSAKMMVPDLGLQMQTDASYAEDLLGFKFQPARGCIEDAAKSVVRLGLV